MFAIGVLLVVGALVVSTDNAVERTVFNAGSDLVGALAIIIGVRRYLPRVPAAWLLFAAALGVWMVGDILWGFYLEAGEEPVPSLADLFYLLTFPFFAAALLVATYAQDPAFRWRALIDPAIVTVAAGYAAWVFLVAPAVSDPDAGGGAKFLAVVYPVTDLLLAAIAVRFMLRGQWRERSLRLLVIGLVVMFVGDVWYALAPEESEFHLRLAEAALVASPVLIGLAGLHPSMPALTARKRQEQHEELRGRLPLVVATTLIVPLVLLIQALRDKSLELLAAVIATMLLATLLVVRYAASADWVRRAAMRERIVSEYAAALLAAHETDDLYRIAEKAAAALAGSGSAVFVRDGNAPPSDAATLTVPVKVGGEHEALLVVTGARSDLEEKHDAFASVLAQLALALERQRLLDHEQEAARTLNEQNERLRELDDMKDQFVSSVSHELRTPLTSIVGYIELLNEGEVGELNDDQRHFLEVVNRNCTRLTRLVDDILFVARVDSGRLSLEMQSVDFAELVAASVQSALPVAEGKDMALRLEAEPGMAPLWADPTRITQLLDNLISNAVKFTSEGGSVTVVVAQRGDSCHLEVRDSGVGIPADELDRLFVRFFRASTSPVASGTGLGLAIAKSIVEAHRGTIAVESELGVGTTFLVDLPRQAPQHAASTQEESIA